MKLFIDRLSERKVFQKSFVLISQVRITSTSIHRHGHLSNFKDGRDWTGHMDQDQVVPDGACRIFRMHTKNLLSSQLPSASTKVWICHQRPIINLLLLFKCNIFVLHSNCRSKSLCSMGFLRVSATTEIIWFVAKSNSDTIYAQQHPNVFMALKFAIMENSTSDYL